MNEQLMLAMANFLRGAYNDHELQEDMKAMYKDEGAFSLTIEDQEEYPHYKAKIESAGSNKGNKASFHVYPDDDINDNLVLQAMSEVAYTFASYYLSYYLDDEKGEDHNE